MAQRNVQKGIHILQQAEELYKAWKSANVRYDAYGKPTGTLHIPELITTFSAFGPLHYPWIHSKTFIYMSIQQHWPSALGRQW